jgi:dienelactone hydrolase
MKAVALRGRVIWATVACACSLALAPGAAPAAAGGAHFRISPAYSLEDQPLKIVVTGLPRQTAVEVALTSTSYDYSVWSSDAWYWTGSTGSIDLSRAWAFNPRGCWKTTSLVSCSSYTKVWPMGLVAQMKPVSPTEYPSYLWSPKEYPGVYEPFYVSVWSEAPQTQLGETTFWRRLNPPDYCETPYDSGLGHVGDLFYPAQCAPEDQTRVHGPARFARQVSASMKGRTAVLVLGGSEGGEPFLISELLADHGYPSLALAYFGVPHLPSVLEDIPLERVEAAVRWLRNTVRPRRLLILGDSRGSEAALVVAAHDPLVDGVIALSPSSVVHGCYNPRPYDCPADQSAWTLGGKAVPFTNQWNVTDPRQTKAVIPVEQIRGPVLLICGTKDPIWSSCKFADAIAERRARAHPHEVTLVYRAKGAGHLVGAIIPDQPEGPLQPVDKHEKHLLVTDEKKREQLWPRLLAFLASQSSRSG